MKLYPLNKIVLALHNNPSQFLNGLTSNSLDKPANAFLNIHGRIIATFDQLKVNDNEFLIVIEKQFLEAVLQHIDRYVRLAGVKVEQLSTQVYFDLEGNVPTQTNDYVVPQKVGRLIITTQELSANVSAEEFTLFRLKNNIPAHGIDYMDEFLLNVSEVDAVSFTKGCFLGQEPVSKVHNRSRPSWKLVVRYENECSDEEKQKMTSKVIDRATQRTLGFVFVKNE